ncbi:TPA: phage tail protein [Mannheimia haemolytica]|uniref:phage tail protein n=1 Tax=Mannheimia haemolytica TaxID=75985 RepID=UPI0011BB5561|nr:phage tail protein [Mannheimia haemolytica]QEA80122.1 phage tail protein [Mannheimia haemolytica]HDL4154945.1 phage tail protein [Mannheimia haemolytica]HDL5278016.1 phage tail protein [Mannheimia haemolytica]
MKQVMNPINTPTQRFKDGNPATGEYGTIVTAEFLNNVQDSVINTQQELHSVLAEAGIEANDEQVNQVAKAIKKIAGDATRDNFNALANPDGYKHIGRCKSVAELRTIRPTEHGQRILVDAYYEDGTTGGGEFVADLQDLVTPDDGGVCFVVNNNGGRWKRVDLSHLTLFDFWAVGDGVTNDESAFVNAMRYSQFFIENGTFRINNAVNSVRDNVKILGNKTGKLVLGAGIQQAGAEVFNINHSNYFISGFYIETPNKAIGIRFKSLDDAGVKNLHIDNVVFNGTFYGVRAGESIQADTNYPTDNVIVQNCQSYCGSGNAGHYLCTKVKGVRFFNNIAIGGRNVSAYGATSCSDIFIFGNREQGMAVTTVDVEAGVQVEDVQTGECVVANNIFSHDIWMSGAKNAIINSNLCRRLRVTSGNPTDTGSNNVEFSNNQAKSIAISKYGSFDNPSLFIDNINFINNILEPSEFNQDVYIDGTILKQCQFINNRCISKSKQYSVRLARNNPCLNLTFKSNKLSDNPAIISGKQGVIFCDDLSLGVNKHRLRLRFSSPINFTVNQEWQKMPFDRVLNDINGHVDIVSGQFIARTGGTFHLKGKITVTNSSEDVLNLYQLRLLINNEEKERLINQSVSPKNSKSNTNGMTTINFDTVVDLKVGDIVDLQYKTTHELTLLSDSFLSQIYVTQEF